MKRFIVLLTAILTVSWPLSSLAITFTSPEISGVVKITSNLKKESIDLQIRSLADFYNADELAEYRQQLEEQVQSGSGFIVNFAGCALTNKHVVYDEAVGAAHQNIHLWSTGDLTKPLNDLGKASIVYMRTLDDIAIVCPDDTGGKFFNRLFVKTDDYQGLALALGEPIFTLGYPENGGGNLTLTSGLVSGVWDEKTIKTTMPVTAGASGSPVFNEKKQVVGIAQGNTGPFDQLGLFLNPPFVLDWYEGYKQVYREIMTDLSKGCTDTKIRGIYQKENPASPAARLGGPDASQGKQEYYDLTCTFKRNFGLEAKITSEYQRYCQADLRIEDMVAASAYIASNRSTVDYWSAYLESTCLKSTAVSVFKVKE